MGELIMFEKQLKEWSQNRSQYRGIKPTFDKMWCIRGGDVVSDLKRAVLIRDGVIK